MRKKSLELSHEEGFWSKGNDLVFGVDEAGRGCLAGPLSAAVYIWPKDSLVPAGLQVRDSKELSPEIRDKSAFLLKEGARTWGQAFASADEIDQWNVLNATSIAVARAIEIALARLINQGFSLPYRSSLDAPRLVFLTDGSQQLVHKSFLYIHKPEFAPEFPLMRELYAHYPEEITFIKGDSKVFSIAAASILAKTIRDERMKELDMLYPSYQFGLHKGYSTKVHMEKLKEYGPSPEHRKTFAPVSEVLPQ